MSQFDADAYLQRIEADKEKLQRELETNPTLREQVANDDLQQLIDSNDTLTRSHNSSHDDMIQQMIDANNQAEDETKHDTEAQHAFHAYRIQREREDAVAADEAAKRGEPVPATTAPITSVHEAQSIADIRQAIDIDNQRRRDAAVAAASVDAEEPPPIPPFQSIPLHRQLTYATGLTPLNEYREKLIQSYKDANDVTARTYNDAYQLPENTALIIPKPKPQTIASTHRVVSLDNPPPLLSESVVYSPPISHVNVTPPQPQHVGTQSVPIDTTSLNLRDILALFVEMLGNLEFIEQHQTDQYQQAERYRTALGEMLATFSDAIHPYEFNTEQYRDIQEALYTQLQEHIRASGYTKDEYAAWFPFAKHFESRDGFIDNFISVCSYTSKTQSKRIMSPIKLSRQRQPLHTDEYITTPIEWLRMLETTL